MSVPQIDVARVWTRTSFSPGEGTGCCEREKPPRSSAVFVHAIIVVGMILIALPHNQLAGATF
jgi:hypothetical protein